MHCRICYLNEAAGLVLVFEEPSLEGGMGLGTTLASGQGGRAPPRKAAVPVNRDRPLAIGRGD